MLVLKVVSVTDPKRGHERPSTKQQNGRIYVVLGLYPDVESARRYLQWTGLGFVAVRQCLGMLIARRLDLKLTVSYFYECFIVWKVVKRNVLFSSPQTDYVPPRYEQGESGSEWCLEDFE